MIMTVVPADFDFTVEVCFPVSGPGSMSARAVTVMRTDVHPHEVITTAGGMSLYMEASGIIWAHLEMWADHDGNPIATGVPVYGPDHQIVTKVFTVRVTTVLAKTSYNDGYRDGHSAKYGPPKTAPLRMLGRKAVRT